MTHKSKTITLCILGAIAAVVSCFCCCNVWEDANQQNAQGQGGGGHVQHRTRGFWPIFLGGGSHWGGGGSHVGTGTSSGTSRGGFGSTSGHGGSSGGAHGGGAGA